MASRQFEQPSAGVQIITSGFFVNHSVNNPDSINEDRCSIAIRNRHVSGSIVLKVDKEYYLNNEPLGYVPAAYAPKTSAYYPAYIQPTQWGMSSESAKTAYININKQIVLNWGETPTVGKRICICLNYDY